MTRSKPQLPALLLAALVSTTVWAGSASAEKGVTLYDHQHRETHTTTRESSTTHTQSSTTRTHSSSSVSVDRTGTAEILGSWLLPNPHRNLPKLRSVSPRHVPPAIRFAVKAPNGKWGIVDENGRTILEPRYQSVTSSGTVLAAMEKGHAEPATFNLDGKPVPPPEAIPGLYPFKEKNRWGFKDEKGNIMLTSVYRAIVTDFREGIAFVVDDKGKQVAIDEKGKVLFAAPYDEVSPFQDGLAEVRRHVKRFNWASLASLTLANVFWHNGWSYDPYTDGPLDMAWDGQKRGYLDTRGREVIDSHNDAVYPMTPWGTFVQDKGKVWFSDRQGRVIFGPGDYDITGGSLDEIAGLASVKEKASGKYGIIDLSDGSLRLPFAWDAIVFLGGDRFTVKKGKSTQLVDETTGRVLQSWDTDVTFTPFGAGAEVTWLKGNTWQLVDRAGNVRAQLPKAALDQVSPFQGKGSIVKSNGQWGLMDQTGQWVLQGMKKIKEVSVDPGQAPAGQSRTQSMQG